MRIIHFPLESYKERYTAQLSGRNGWLESNWLKAKIPYVRIEGDSIDSSNLIKTGSVLDGCGRGYFSCSQISNFLQLLNNGDINSDDVLFFDDFWTPGIEALPYAFHLTGIKPKMYSLLHAQSVDEFDFTHSMKYWIRDFEKGIANIMDGIFVTSTILKNLLNVQLNIPKEKIYITGLPYNSTKVIEYADLPFIFEKEKQVVFSSRFDEEKEPDFFLIVVEEMNEIDNTIKFVITTSQEKLRSNNPHLLEKLQETLSSCSNLELRENQSKQQYYRTLAESKIQFNCAKQDFVSWTLLEALTFNCTPVYPYYRSFPEVLPNDYLYTNDSVNEACKKISKYIYNNEFDPRLTRIVNIFDNSWLRMLNIMKTPEKEIQYPLFE